MDSSSSSPAPDMALLGFINALYGSILNCNPSGKPGARNVCNHQSIEEQIYNLHVEILARDTIIDRFGKRFTFRSREEHRHRRRLKKYCNYLRTHIALVKDVLAGLLPVVKETREQFNTLMSGFSLPDSHRTLTPNAVVLFGHHGCCYNCYARMYEGCLKDFCIINCKQPAGDVLKLVSQRCVQTSFVRSWTHMHKLRLTVCITKEIKISLENKLQQTVGLLAYHAPVHSPVGAPTVLQEESFAMDSPEESGSPAPEEVWRDGEDPPAGASLDPTATLRSPGLDFDRRPSTASPMPDDSLPYDQYTFVPSVETSKRSVLEFCEIPAMVLHSNPNVMYYSKKLRIMQKFGNPLPGSSRQSSIAVTKEPYPSDAEGPTDAAPQAGSIRDVCTLILALFPRYMELNQRNPISLVDSGPNSDPNNLENRSALSPDSHWNEFVTKYLAWKQCKYALEKQFSSLLMELFKFNAISESSEGTSNTGSANPVAVGKGDATAGAVGESLPSLTAVERLIVNWQRMVHLGSPVPVSGSTSSGPITSPEPQRQSMDGPAAVSSPVKQNEDAECVSLEAVFEGDFPSEIETDDIDRPADADADADTDGAAFTQQEDGTEVEDAIVDIVKDKSQLYASPRSVLVFAKYAGRMVYESVRQRVSVGLQEIGGRPVSESDLKSCCNSLVKNLLLRNICKKVLLYSPYNAALQQRDSRLLRQHTKVHYLCTAPRAAAVPGQSCCSSYSQSTYSFGSSGPRSPTPRGGLAAWGQGWDELNVAEADRRTLALLGVVGVSPKWAAEVARQCTAYTVPLQGPQEPEPPSLAHGRLSTFASAPTAEGGLVALHDYLVSVVFRRSIRMLSLLQSAVVPQEHLSILVCAVKWMMIDASGVCSDYRLEEEGLDETLPFIVLLVLLGTTNCVHNLNLLLHLMREYECPAGQSSSSEEQYYLTCIEAAVSYIIQNLDADLLLSGVTTGTAGQANQSLPCNLALLQYEDEKALELLREWLNEQLVQDDVSSLISSLYLQGYL